MVAGTSIGAFVGALYCEETDAEKVERRAREWSKNMAGIWNKIVDLTYPTTSLFTGIFYGDVDWKVYRTLCWIPSTPHPHPPSIQLNLLLCVCSKCTAMQLG